MSIIPTLLILISAVLVAGVGVLMKRSKDKLVFRAVLSVSSAAIVLPAVIATPTPTGMIWVYLVAGAIAHFAYQLAYISAFERGDMSLVFPLMRGSAPAIAGIFAFGILGESLSGREVAGLVLIVLAIMAFTWPSGRTEALPIMGVILALLTGGLIALYSVVDAAGIRFSKQELGQGWTYIAWFFLLDGIGVPVLAYMWRRETIWTSAMAELKTAFPAGALSLFSFGLALFAFSMAPVAPMLVLRETSVLFGAVFAAYFLREPFGLQRTGLAVVIFAGLLLMQT
ncbi:DMT family transporter [Parasphingorhabdus litoris]|uniref:DMT family transporter n=1 Tax=Parasphingorhabdus litoris TaxID=394733 RepID=A0ABN1A0X3_9SPHN|nr:DMT family transporter [Parasphingorhabdus litoris]